MIMEWFIVIIIAIVAGLLFGFATRDEREKQKINLWWAFFVGIISFFLTGFMPLLITLWCALAYYIYRSRIPVGIDNSPDCRGFVMFCVVGIIFIFLYFSIPATTETIEVGNVSLTALRSAVASSGTFYFLGSGSIGANFYYVYGYMQGPEYMQGLIKKTPEVHVYPNRTDERGNIIFYKSFYVRNVSAWPINLAFNGAPERTDNDSWTDILIPPDSIMQGMKI
jgi:hypothetical protein